MGATLTAGAMTVGATLTAGAMTAGATTVGATPTAGDTSGSAATSETTTAGMTAGARIATTTVVSTPGKGIGVPGRAARTVARTALKATTIGGTATAAPRANRWNIIKTEV